MRYCEKKRILLCNVLLRQKVWSFGGATSYFRSHGHIGPEIAARSTRLTIRVQWRSRLMRTASRRWPGQLPRAEARRLVRTAVSQAPSLGRHCPKKCIWRGARDENISDSPCEPCRRTSSSLLPFSFKKLDLTNLSPNIAVFLLLVFRRTKLSRTSRDRTPSSGLSCVPSFSFRHVPENQTSFATRT